MAQLLVECPNCRRRLSIKRNQCKCGTPSSKFYPKKYWIEFYDNRGKRKREMIGYSKQAAETRLAKVRILLAEKKFIDSDPMTTTTIGELADWYFDLPEIESLKSAEDYRRKVKLLFNLIPKDTVVSEITKGRIDGYLAKRQTQQCSRGKKGNVKSYTANLELTVLNIILNKAVAYQVIKTNPMASMRRRVTAPARNRVLTEEEYQLILSSLVKKHADFFRLAYLTGMRYQEIAQLKWKEVDLNKWLIHLPAERCKNKTARSIPIHHPELQEIFNGIEKGEEEAKAEDYVFGNKINGVSHPCLRHPYRQIHNTCKRLGIEDFRFHDLRHCAVTNFRKAGVHDLVIMSIIGHKSMAMFQRYNTIVEDELREVRWMGECDIQKEGGSEVLR